MAIKIPVVIDQSVGTQDFLDITNSVTPQGVVTYNIEVRGPDKSPLYRITSADILDRVSISVLVAREFARDSNFGFGKDQKPYRWTGNCWEQVEKWFSDVGLSMHALIRVAANKRAGPSSLEAEAISAWRTSRDYPLDGLDLRAFGKCPGIPFQDCIWKVTKGKVDLVPHDPKNMNTRVLALDAQTAANHYLDLEMGEHQDSLLMRFLRSSLDEDQLITVRRWFGYHLIANRVPNAEKFLYLYGTGSNGKSQILHLIRGLVGKDACAELRLNDLKVLANYEALVSKLAMIGSEASTSTELESLKLIVSREPVRCNPKFRDPFNVFPECLVSQASNHPPHFEEKSDAMSRRVIALHLKNTFRESDDRVEDIAQRIIDEEYPLLVGFAMQGAHEISETGKFELPASIREHSTQEVSAGNPLETFALLLEFGSFETEEREMYEAYKRWSLEGGLRPMSSKEFKEELERFAVKHKQHLEVHKRLSTYEPSSWINDRQQKVLVYPALADLKSRPYGYRGVRVAEGYFGAPIGQEKVEGSSRTVS